MARSREEEREYRRKWREQKRAEVDRGTQVIAEGLDPDGAMPKGMAQAVVRHLRAAPPAPRIVAGHENEDEVRAELEALGDIAVLRSGLARSALTMARILDNADTWQHPAAANQLRAALESLHRAAEAKPAEVGKLAELRAARRRRDGVVG